MALQPELLDRMKALDPLDCATRLYSWPTRHREGYGEAYDEFARITGSWPSNWKWGNEATFAADMKRCDDAGASICLHVSPPIPSGTDWEAARDAYADRWRVVGGLLDLKRVAVVYIDLEDFPYIPNNGTDETFRFNEAVHNYNAAIYRIAKQFVGDDIEVRRYNHLDTRYEPHPDYGELQVSQHTANHDPIDGGWGVSMYQPMNGWTDLRNLRATIEQGQRHGIQAGTVWASVGCSRIDWLCPGVAVPWEKINNTARYYACPYHPRISHKLGSLFSHEYWRRTIHGDDGRNGTYPALDKVHSVVLWPDVFRAEMDQTAVHLIAFLEGMAAKKYEPRLAELQAEAVAL